MEIAILSALLAVVWYYGYSIKNSVMQAPPPDPAVEHGLHRLEAIEKTLGSIEHHFSEYARHHRNDFSELGKHFERLGALEYELRSIQEVLSNIQHDLSIIVYHPAFTHERT